MRSTFGPALATHKLSLRHEPDLGRLNFMRSPRTANILKVAAAGEFIVDKLPQTPSCTQPGPVVWRMMSRARSAARRWVVQRVAREVGKGIPAQSSGRSALLSVAIHFICAAS